MASIHSCQHCYPYSPSPQPSLDSSPSSFVQIQDQFQENIGNDCSNWYGQFQLLPGVPEVYWSNVPYLYQPVLKLETYSDMSCDLSSNATVPQATEETLANLQKLSQEYQPEIKGPLVGSLSSSRALENEYAGADPVFIKKTAALAPKYSHYRTIRGDGNCGWRALAFGYLELVLRSGSSDFAYEELARITSLNNVLNSAGFAEYLYEDFVEETVEALRTIASVTSNETRYQDKVLLEIFNTQEKSDAIITHIKLLTSAWMKTMPEPYEPFIETSIAQYCDAHVEPYGVEIDHIGVNGLIDCLILPAGFAVEIIYLDRSFGEEVNIHRFEKMMDNKVITPSDAPVIHILYRPGHYDLLYKNGDVPISPPSDQNHTPATSNIQISMMHSQQYYNEPSITSFFGLQSHSFKPPQKVDFQPEIPKTIPYPSTPFNDMPSNFRPSAFQLKAIQEMPFQTKTFKNSHFNTSHFLNDNFQPEMYNPDGSDDDEPMY